MKKPNVVFFQRKPYPSGNYSLEFIFSGVRDKLCDEINSSVSECRFYSQGIVRRVFNFIEAAFKQGDVNLITGDIHYVSFFLKKRKTILMIADCGFLSDVKGLKNFLSKLIWLTLPVKRASYITTISEHAKQDILKYVKCDANKVIVIPVSISDKFKYAPKDFNTDMPVLLQIGQAKNKNLTRIIEAIKGMSVRLSIIGNISPENEDLLHRYNINYVASYNLSEQEIIQQYIDSDMLIFPSTYEGFGMPIVEAQSVGRPVVTSSVTSMPWVAGDGACLVDPFSVESIRAGIMKVIDDKRYRETLITNGLKNIKRFDSNTIAEMYLKIIKKAHEGGK